MQIYHSPSWLNSASVSLANLNKVKPNVYNFGIADPRDLKGTNLSARRNKDEHNERVAADDGTDGNLQKTAPKAWGSNHSIPDLLNQYSTSASNLPKPTRPSSAKNSNRPGSAKYSNSSRLRPPSGKKPRPQSAKEPIGDGKVSETITGVKGAKCDPSGRPPKGIPPGSNIGWVGPPAGLKYPDRPQNGQPWTLELPLGDDNPQGLKGHDGHAPHMGINQEREAPPPPNTSPVPPSPKQEEKTKRVFELYIGDPYNMGADQEDVYASSDEEDVYITEALVNQNSHSSNQSPEFAYTNGIGRESANEKESLRLSLPMAEDDYDEADEMDTERLLAEAESVSQQFDLKNILKANQNIPPERPHLSDDPTNQKEATYELTTENALLDNGRPHKAKAEELVNEIINENGLEFESNSNVSADKKTGVNSKSEVKFNEDVTTVNITPRNMGRKVEELYHGKKKHHSPDNFVDLIEMKNRIEPVLATGKAGFSEREHVTPKPRSFLTHSPEKDSGTLDQSKQRISGTMNDAKTFMSVRNKTVNVSQPRSAPLNRSAKPITKVTVDYGELDGQKNNETISEMPSRKAKKSQDDVVTAMQQLKINENHSSNSKNMRSNKLHSKTKELRDTHMDDTLTNLTNATTVCRSDPERNYYELSRHSSMSNASIKEEKPSLIHDCKSVTHDTTAVVKTTKTIEFDKEDPREISVKSVLDQPAVYDKERDKHRVTTPDLKARKPPSRPSSAKPPVPKKPADLDSQERPGSRLGFVAMETDLSPREKIASKHKRPSSAPVIRKPMQNTKTKDLSENTLLQNEIQTVGEDGTLKQTLKQDESLKLTLDKKKKKSSAREKEEREKVIDNLLERTKTLVDSAQEQETAEDSKPKLTSVPRKPRPFSAHTGTLGGCPGHGSKHSVSKRPTSAIHAHKHHTKSAGTRPSKSSGKQRVILTEPCFINSNTPYFEEEETEEDLACKELERKLADKGLSISAATLQRALYPPSGKTKYYQITAELPKKSSLSLLSHPKTWLPEEYKRLQRAEKTLERANEIMFLREKAEKRKAYLASLTEEEKKKLKKRKGKKGGKKLRRSKSTL